MDLLNLENKLRKTSNSITEVISLEEVVGGWLLQTRYRHTGKMKSAHVITKEEAMKLLECATLNERVLFDSNGFYVITLD